MTIEYYDINFYSCFLMHRAGEQDKRDQREKERDFICHRFFRKDQ